MTLLPDEVLCEWLPLGAEIQLTPIWQCTDFFNLQKNFDDMDTDGSGALNAVELSRMLLHVTGAAPKQSEIAELIAKAKLISDDEETYQGTSGFTEVSFEEFCGTGFAETRLITQLHLLAGE